MAHFNLYDARTQLSRLVERAAAGKEIVIAKGGRPLARLVPLAPCRPPRHHGDPFDRMLVAQARLDGLVLVSEDPAIDTYDVQRFIGV